MNILANKAWLNFDFEMMMEKNAIANSNLEFYDIAIRPKDKIRYTELQW
jgi:hypothetical protein